MRKELDRNKCNATLSKANNNAKEDRVVRQVEDKAQAF